MIQPSIIVDLAAHQVHCDTHGVQHGVWCCQHILRGVPAVSLEEPRAHV